MRWSTKTHMYHFRPTKLSSTLIRWTSQTYKIIWTPVVIPPIFHSRIRVATVQIIAMNTSSSTRKPYRDKGKSPRKCSQLQWRSNWILRLLCRNRQSRIVQLTYQRWMICLMRLEIYKAHIRVRRQFWSSSPSTFVRCYYMLSPTCFFCPITFAMRNRPMELTYFSQAVNVFLPISASTRIFELRGLITRTICKIGSHFLTCNVSIQWL